MTELEGSVRRVGLTDVLTITRMAYQNMEGSDRQFTQLMANPLTRLASYVTLPFYFLLAGSGYKYMHDGRIAGCAYLHLHSHSGYIFNVNVNKSYRRQGVAQELMRRIELETGRQGRWWTTLLVDSDNQAARSLYNKIGYQPYNVAFLRFEGLLPPLDSEAPSLHLERMGAFSGRNLYRRYLAHEKTNGESIDPAAINDYGSVNLSGEEYWRCAVGGREIGAVMKRGSDSTPAFHLAFDHTTWGNDYYPAIATVLASQLPAQPQIIDLLFGSSGHFQRAKEVLARHGFEENYQAKMLMFKHIHDEESADFEPA